MATKRKSRAVKKREEAKESENTPPMTEDPVQPAQPEQPIVVTTEEVTVKDMTSDKKPFKFTKLTFILPVAVLLIVVLAGGGYYLYTVKQKTAASAKPANEAQALVEKVGRLIELPTGESPTVATVTDVIKLKDQEFFTRAQNGDKVLIYQGAKKAILYRPATKKIIEVGPVNIAATQISHTVASASTSATPSPTPTKAQPIKLALYNGTKTNGLTKKAEKELSDKKILVDVVAKGNAKTDYAQTLIVVLNGTAEQGKAVAQALDGKVAALPEGEEKPESDILVILGKDFADR